MCLCQFSGAALINMIHKSQPEQSTGSFMMETAKAERRSVTSHCSKCSICGMLTFNSLCHFFLSQAEKSGHNGGLYEWVE